MKNIFNYWFLLILLLVIMSCHNTHIPVDVQQAIENFGNESELENAIQHYQKEPKDSLKLKAAYFLIANMPGWYYYEGEVLSHYQDYLKLIRRDKNHGEYYKKCFKSLYSDFDWNKVQIKYDIEEITSEQLIENIDLAFKVWEQQPWGKYVDFNNFCEYILPFRMGDEIPEHNRKEIYTEFNSLLSRVKNNGDVLGACKIINNDLKNPEWLFSMKAGFLPHFKSSQLMVAKAGSCREMTDLATYAMRSVGIPTSIDFVPQWPTHKWGHETNAVLNKDGKMVPFMGCESNPDEPHMTLDKRAKVYRHTYSINKKSLGYLYRSNGKDIPGILTDPRIIDVTKEYAKCHNIQVKLNSATNNSKLVYINVFDNQSWIPIDWGKRENDKVRFNNMEGDIAYLAGFYKKEDRTIPASEAFVLNAQGQVHYLKPNPDSVIKEFSLTRIFPVIEGGYYITQMAGGKFQGANNPDFSDAENLYVIPGQPKGFWTEIPVHNPKKFRYLRYYRARQAEMGELEFYSHGNKLVGTHLGNNIKDKKKHFDNAFDNDIYTYYMYDTFGVVDDYAYVGIDLKQPKVIDKIRFSPPLVNVKANNKIINDHIYRLSYWNNGDWTTLSTQKAKIGQVIFKEIPSNALYTVTDETEKSDHRIFTYENGKIVFR